MPGRTTAVFIVKATPQELIDFLIADIEGFVETGDIEPKDARLFIKFLKKAQEHLDNGKPHNADNSLRSFIQLVETWTDRGQISPEVGAYLVEQAEIIRGQLD